jgi:hypothetical protein
MLENRFDDNGMVGIRQEKIALIPSAPGQFTIPAIEIPWWNTQTDQMEVAQLPARTIEVLPAPGAPNQPQPSTPITSGEPVADAMEIPPALVPPANTNTWIWLSLALAIGWLATALGWLWSRQRAVKKPAVNQASPSQKKLVAAINTACSNNDTDAVKLALLNWAALQWPGSRVRSLGDLAARLEGDLQQQVHHLSQAIYSGMNRNWDEGALLWRAFEARQHEHAAQSPSPGAELEPLYLN